MSRAAAASRRLPGVRFVAQPPALPDPLPRMDVAAFVGFAASGPLHVPVAVEDPQRFEALFGGDYELARDLRTGESRHAHLAPSVRAFLRNGGRRCWVVRVADENRAMSNRFPLPGLATCAFPGDGPAVVTQAIAQARSEGSWSDGVQVEAELVGDGVEVVALSLVGPSGADITVRAPHALVAGDLLELAFPDGPILYAPVDALAQPDRVHSNAVLWLQDGAAISAPVMAFWNPGGGEVSAPVLAIDGPVSGSAEPSWSLELAVPFASAPRAGALVRLDGDALLVVHGAVQAGGGSRIAGTLSRILAGPPGAVNAAQAVCRRLSLSLVAATSTGAQRLDGLGFCPLHPRYWGALPTDADLFGSELDAQLDLPQDPLLAGDPRRPLNDDASSPRFPLAGPGGAAAFTIPVGLDALFPGVALGADRSARDPLDRDGLARFDADLFLDQALAGCSTLDLLAEADFVRWQSAEPRSLRGVHALLRVAEVTAVAAPDATQPGWDRTLSPTPPPAAGEEASPAEDPAAFRDCARAALPAPKNVILLETPPIAAGEPFTLQWAEVAAAGATYSVEEAERPDFLDAEEISQSGEPSLTVQGRDAGVHYFRVRALLPGRSGPASAGLAVAVAPASAYALRVPVHPATGLLAVQRALLRMCCARGDLIALLSLPAGTLEDEAVRHSAWLRSAAPAGSVPGIGIGEDAALSYGALHHPWLVLSEEGKPDILRTLPPEGPCLGMLARRTLSRGAWIAAANEPLSGVVALDPELDEDRRLDLQDAQVNLVLQDPRGFLTLSEDTLSSDPDLVPIHVRRLLILLKRAALRLGTLYVFEPGDRSFHRLVQRGFEDMLGSLFRRGAFSGETPEQGYQVISGADPRGEDQGRFVVDLKVAPAPALRLLTVRLVQTGGQGSVAEVS